MFGNRKNLKCEKKIKTKEEEEEGKITQKKNPEKPHTLIHPPRKKY
jgi:hypothetical protein